SRRSPLVRSSRACMPPWPSSRRWQEPRAPMDVSDAMNAQDMLDYTLGLVESPAREEMERQVEADGALTERIARLHAPIRNLVDDEDEIEPPPSLAARTLARVAERRHRRGLMDLVPARVPFRWGDLAVAASIFVAGLLTLVPAVNRARSRADEAACAFHL